VSDTVAAEAGLDAQVRDVTPPSSPIPRRRVVLVGAVGVLVLILASFFGAPPYDHGGPGYTTMSGHTYYALIPDSVAYLQMADAHHGGVGTAMRPFASRLLAPTLAGLLPVDAGVGLRIVNLVFLCLGLVALTALIASWVRRTASLAIAVLLYATALPVVLYAMRLMIDAAAVGAVTICIWVIARRPLWNGLVAIVLAVLIKETALVLVPFAVAMEFTVRPGPRRRAARAAAWCASGVIGLALASLGARGTRILFIPWLPKGRQLVSMNLHLNLSRGATWLQAGLAILVPVVSLIVGLVATRKHWIHIEPVRFVPYVVGAIVSGLLWVWSALAAWWDFRTAWLMVPFTLPITAILVDAVLVRGVRATASDRRTRRLVIELAAVGLAACLVVAGLKKTFSLHYANTAVTHPRLVNQHVKPGAPNVEHRAGHGPTTIAVPKVSPHGPIVVDLEVPSPTHVRLALSGSSVPTYDARLDGQGTFLLDSTDPSPKLTIDVPGNWTARFRPVGSLPSWNVASAVNGNGPNVLVIPGGSPLSADASFTSATPGSHFALVGDCRIPNCPDERAGVLPVGLEALVIDEPGTWSVTPKRIHVKGQVVTMADLGVK
jgi:hypothetical protein